MFHNCNFEVVWIFLFYLPDRLLYFAVKEPNSALKLHFLRRLASQNSVRGWKSTFNISHCQIYMLFEPEFLNKFSKLYATACRVTSKFRSNSWTKKSIWYMNLPLHLAFYRKSSLTFHATIVISNVDPEMFVCGSQSG